MVTTKERNYHIDNVKAVMIFLVVLGHFLTTNKCVPAQYLYKVIYFFHMPILVFISGYLSKFNFKKMFCQLILPLILFQILYGAYNYLIYGDSRLEWNKCAWGLWYLLTLFYHKIILQIIIKLVNKRFYFWIFLSTIIFGLLIGFVPLSDEFSFSRTFVFFPIFFLGFLIRTNHITLKKTKFWINCLLIILVISLMSLTINLGIVNSNLFGSQYYKNDKDLLFRFLQYIVVFLMIYLLFSNQINKKIKPLTFIARYSIFVYLLHGFVIILFRKYKLLPSNGLGIFYAILLAVALCLILASVGYCYIFLKNKLIYKNKVMKNKTKEKEVIKNAP
jgi:fucose 4-O-acetylase-like acetyltransferase